MASTASASTTTSAAVAGRKEVALSHYMEGLQQDNNQLRTQLKEMKAKVAKLEKLVGSNKQNNFAPKKKSNSDDADNADDEPLIPQSNVMQFLITHGGASRFTMLDDNWHAKHPTAANQLFGFKTWKETKECLERNFPGMDMAAPSIYRKKGNTLMMNKEASEMEKCLCIKLMDRVGFTKGRAALLYGCNDRTITHWRRVWGPKWGLDDLQFFQSKPMIGPSAMKKRKLTQGAFAEKQIGTQPGPPRHQDDATESAGHLLFLSDEKQHARV
jgi:hypothetical protein